jgi:TonB family protein
MYFEFEDYRPDTPRLDPPISKREGVLLSIVAHAVFVLAVIFVLPHLDNPEARRAALQRAEQLALEQEEQAEAQRRFVFVQPRIDREALKAPTRSEDSDKNRVAQAPERAPDPRNPLPFARGNSSERVEATKRQAQVQPTPEMPPEQPSADRTPTDSPPAGDRSDTASAGKRASSLLADARTGPQLATETARSGMNGPGSLNDALRNLQRYVQQESFENPQGGAAQFGPWIQFDTKGVEFGPWIRRFVAQIRSNWNVPYAAMAMQGHVVVTFNVHKSGAISELQVAEPAAVGGFNNAAINALAASNPTYPLPSEYPSDSAFFTITFYYNETPPGQ